LYNPGFNRTNSNLNILAHAKFRAAATAVLNLVRVGLSPKCTARGSETPARDGEDVLNLMSINKDSLTVCMYTNNMSKDYYSNPNM
jgi:hypothetical protein